MVHVAKQTNQVKEVSYFLCLNLDKFVDTWGFKAGNIFRLVLVAGNNMYIIKLQRLQVAACMQDYSRTF